VYNLGKPGLLTKHMTLGLTFNELRLRFSNPRLTAEPTRAFDGVVEMLEFGQLEPLLLVPMLENVRELRVDLDVISTRVPDQYVEMLRGLPVRLRDVARAHGFAPLESAPMAAGKGQLKGPPSPARAPFDAARAKQHQNAWASYLGMPVETVNSIGMKLALIPPGQFLMGSPEFEEGRQSNEMLHQVRITKPFYLGVYEVTQEEYNLVVGSNPSYFKGGKRPVELVSWEQAVEFCRKLSAKEGQEYRLPTEAEWEYACRAGTITPFSFGTKLDWDQANCIGNGPLFITGPSKRETVRVGSYQPNGFGLCDMHGNVWEWCADLFDEKYFAASPVDDPPGPTEGSFRVFRGSAWDSNAWECRTAVRDHSSDSWTFFNLGFRVARAVPRR
jgi:formylglycine-generating enzyme required for sulfatase activity